VTKRETRQFVVTALIAGIFFLAYYRDIANAIIYTSALLGGMVVGGALGDRLRETWERRSRRWP